VPEAAAEAKDVGAIVCDVKSRELQTGMNALGGAGSFLGSTMMLRRRI
jgi:hypothetical protein